MLGREGWTMIRRWVLPGVAAFTVTLVILLLSNRAPPPTLAIPADDDVIELRASLHKSQFWNNGIPEFVVPAEHVPIILGQLRPPEYIPKPWPLNAVTEVGHVVICSRDGNEMKIRFFEAG